MPTYEYRCMNCGYEFEELQKITDPPLAECPECHGEVQRLISGGGGILFKGTGFHVTDYRSPDYKKQAEKDKPGKTPGKSDKKKKKKSE